ncbi:AraC family transcriptional regulator [Actinokineospora guangxiensis]|uniref:AraC family transcriptional regulator n=1 Tax=Actinokineospora guangxiensis TaxID=1490288 RepID=A0ABW0EUE4_9PSEU
MTFDDPVTRHWDFPRAVAGVAVLVRFAADHGVGPAHLLAGTGVTLGDLSAPDGCVEAHQELRVVRNLVSALPAAGLALGRRYHATTFGMLGYAFLSSRTMLDAVNTALRYLDLTFAFTSPSASIDADGARLTLDTTHLPADVTRFLVDRDLAAIHTVLGELAGSPAPLRSLSLPYPAPEELSELHATFDPGGDAVISFGAPIPTATYDPALLARELPLASPETIAGAEAHLTALARARRARTGIAAAVRAELARGVQDMTEVARALATSERTLRRHLAEADTTFQSLLDEHRSAQAHRLLADPALTIAQVATRLGYSDPAAFTHAYRRWHGTTPSAARGF